MTYISTITFLTDSKEKYSYRETALGLIKEAFSGTQTVFLETFQTGFTSAHNPHFLGETHQTGEDTPITAIFLTIIHTDAIEAHTKATLMRELETTYKGQILTRFNKKGLELTHSHSLT